MASEAENLRRIANLEARVQKFDTEIAQVKTELYDTVKKLNNLIATVNGMTKP